MGSSCSQNGKNTEVHSKVLTVKPTGKRHLRRPRRRWEDNVRMNLKEIVSLRGVVFIRLRIGIIEEPL